MKVDHKILLVVGEDELIHAMRHFSLPEDIFLELLERILKDPSDIFVDDAKAPREVHLFYRLESGRYLLAVVKIADDGAFFASAYPVGTSIRNTHKRMRRLRK